MEKKNVAPKTTEYSGIIDTKTLRKMVGVLGMALPVVVYVGSILFDDCTQVQNSISHYYHTGMGDYFVGTLCAVALFMFAYKGYERHDDVIGDFASIFALGVAFFPTAVEEPLTDCIIREVDNGFINTIHFVSATFLFGLLAYFSLFLFTKSDPTKNKTPQKLRRNQIYKTCGCIIVICIVFIGVYAFFLEERFPQYDKWDPIFWLEAIALWAFGIAWLIKGETIFKDNEK